ncbi:hypothetical protein PIB30_101796, partial [Stylosanthes scabra]|nr:hypothetical protein [Stylosanthes scabra]
DDDAAASTNDGDGVGAPGHHHPSFSLGSCPPLSQSPCSTTATGEDSAVTVGITGSEANGGSNHWHRFSIALSLSSSSNSLSHSAFPSTLFTTAMATTAPSPAGAAFPLLTPSLLCVSCGVRVLRLLSSVVFVRV